jgi:hypothetical protein
MLRDRMIGAWLLVSFESTLPDGRVIAAMGRRAEGGIVYSADGYVSVNLTHGNRRRGGEGTFWHALDDSFVGPVARRYMAYSGRFEVDEAREVARHHFDLCLDPALVGTLQERAIRFVDGMLELSVRGAEGVENPSRLLWRRLTDKSGQEQGADTR